MQTIAETCVRFDAAHLSINLVSEIAVPMFPTLRPNVAYLQRETFSFMMSHPAMSFGDRFCDSRKGGTRGGGWVHPEGANSMAVSGLHDRKLGLGRQWEGHFRRFWHTWT